MTLDEVERRYDASLLGVGHPFWTARQFVAAWFADGLPDDGVPPAFGADAADLERLSAPISTLWTSAPPEPSDESDRLPSTDALRVLAERAGWTGPLPDSETWPGWPLFLRTLELAGDDVVAGLPAASFGPISRVLWREGEPYHARRYAEAALTHVDARASLLRLGEAWETLARWELEFGDPWRAVGWAESAAKSAIRVEDVLRTADLLCSCYGAVDCVDQAREVAWRALHVSGSSDS